MKQTYITPRIEIINVDSEEMLLGSNPRLGRGNVYIGNSLSNPDADDREGEGIDTSENGDALSKNAWSSWEDEDDWI